jgi:hypothetical protein
MSPQYPRDEVHHRMLAPHVLRVLVQMPELGYDTRLALSGEAEAVVWESLETTCSTL